MEKICISCFLKGRYKKFITKCPRCGETRGMLAVNAAKYEQVKSPEPIRPASVLSGLSEVVH